MKDFQQFLQEHASQFAIEQGLISTVQSVVQACEQIGAKVRLGALAGVMGNVGRQNIQGEEQKKLDIIANGLLIEWLSANPHVAGLASEEEDSFVALHDGGRYLVLFDPLDGSSNIDVNVSIGTIFSVLHKPEGALSEASFLQKGSQQLASGYVLYGTQTLLVLTFKQGVFVFTLGEQGQWLLTQAHAQISSTTSEFAINASNQRHWQMPVQQYIAQLLEGKEGVRGKNYNMRWVGSMVAEVHRILVRGGVFLYPQDGRSPAGKLRLMYEANPLGLIVEQAGGGAHDTTTDLLDIQPSSLHQRVAVVLGSREETDYIRQLHHNHRN